MGGNRHCQTIGMPNNEGVNVNRNQGRWKGRNFEVTSTEFRSTGQEAGKNLAILTKGRNASCHQLAGPTRQNLKVWSFLFPSSRAKCLRSENTPHKVQ